MYSERELLDLCFDIVNRTLYLRMHTEDLFSPAADGYLSLGFFYGISACCSASFVVHLRKCSVDSAGLYLQVDKLGFGHIKASPRS